MFQSSPALYQRGRLELRIVNAGRFVSILARALSTRAHIRSEFIQPAVLFQSSPALYQRGRAHELGRGCPFPHVSILARALSTRARLASKYHIIRRLSVMFRGPTRKLPAQTG